jgi:hypothetical protein
MLIAVLELNPFFMTQSGLKLLYDVFGNPNTKIRNNFKKRLTFELFDLSFNYRTY